MLSLSQPRFSVTSLKGAEALFLVMLLRSVWGYNGGAFTQTVDSIYTPFARNSSRTPAGLN